VEALEIYKNQALERARDLAKQSRILVTAKDSVNGFLFNLREKT
jgi:hypothetical protein